MAIGCSVDIETRGVGVTGGGITGGSVGSGGDDGDDAGDDGDDPTQDATPAQRVELRRLTRTQYARTIVQLLGDGIAVPTALPPDAIDHFYTSVGTAGLSLGGVDVEQYETAARGLADAVQGDPARRDALVGCDVALAGCLDEFVARFGRLAFRRTLTDAEQTRYVALAQTTAQRYDDAWQGVHAVVATMLASPSFLYLVEIGVPDPDDPQRRRYTSVEMASRLSFFLWGHGPDVALLDRAEAGELDDADVVAEIAAEMLEAPAAKDGFGRFFDEWLGLEAIAAQAKDPAVFPDADAALFVTMAAEIDAMVDDVVFDTDDSVLALLDTRTTFVDDRLAGLYGMAKPGSTTLQPVTRSDDDPRMGLLGTAGVLALTSRRARTAPTLRGIYIQQRWRCVELPPPPPEVDVELPDNPAAEGTPATMRELLEEHATNAQCASCHDKVDPLGLALEHFDALGKWRGDDNGLVIDDSGKLEGTEFHGLAELVALLREDPMVESCVARQLYRYATGHMEREDADGLAVAAMGARLAELDGRLLAFVPELVASEAFRSFAEVDG